MKDISKSYTDRMLLDHIDLGVDSGARIGVIGINGTGKSTLLRLIAGKEEPDSGYIVWFRLSHGDEYSRLLD